MLDAIVDFHMPRTIFKYMQMYIPLLPMPTACIPLFNITILADVSKQSKQLCYLPTPIIPISIADGCTQYFVFELTFWFGGHFNNMQHLRVGMELGIKQKKGPSKRCHLIYIRINTDHPVAKLGVEPLSGGGSVFEVDFVGDVTGSQPLKIKPITATSWELATRTLNSLIPNPIQGPTPTPPSTTYIDVYRQLIAAMVTKTPETPQSHSSLPSTSSSSSSSSSSKVGALDDNSASLGVDLQGMELFPVADPVVSTVAFDEENPIFETTAFLNYSTDVGVDMEIAHSLTTESVDQSPQPLTGPGPGRPRRNNTLSQSTKITTKAPSQAQRRLAKKKKFVSLSSDQRQAYVTFQLSSQRHAMMPSRLTNV